MNTRKYIVTDPCYIMDKRQYREICSRHTGEPDFENQSFPLASVEQDTRRPIVFWSIIGTGGDGIVTRRVKGKDGNVREERVCVDSGMLCVAEDQEGWCKNVGATYPTLKSALAALQRIRRRL